MSEQSHLQKVFACILSSQSYELLQKFSTDETWVALQPEEKEQLAQLFLLSAEVSARVATSESRNQAMASFRSACRLTPTSARAWFRLGSFLALSESADDLKEAVEALKKAVTLDGGFFDAHYCLASATLRLGVLQKDSEAFIQSDNAFTAANALVQQTTSVPPGFFWHWGIVWFLLYKESGEPIDVRTAIEHYEQARQRGLTTADFYNDYANAVIELALITSNEPMIHEAIHLYTEAIEASGESDREEKAMRLFNLGCCFQHLFDLRFDRGNFESGCTAFYEAAELGPETGVIWQRLAHLLFRGARLWHDQKLVEEAIPKFYEAELRGVESSITCALCSQALLWVAQEEEQLSLLNAAEEYAKRAVLLTPKDETVHPEAWAAVALCQHAYGHYFDDASFFDTSLSILQKGLAEHPKNALLWHVLALVKVSSTETYDSQDMLKEALACFVLASRSTYAQLPSFWHDWGNALFFYAEWTDDLDSASEAIHAYEKALELCHERSSSWLCDWGRAVDLVGDLSDDESLCEQAILIFNDVLATDAGCTQALYHMAVSYLHFGEIAEEVDGFSSAILHFEQYLEQNPEDDDALEGYGLAFVHRGVLMRSNNELSNDFFFAEEVLLKAISLGNDHALYHLGCLYSLMGNFSEAIRILQRAFDSDVFPTPEELQEDEWLAPLRSTAAFHDFLRRVTG